MSTALAIASVTQVLKDLLDREIREDVERDIGAAFNVSAVPPDRIETGEGRESTQLNLFMYQATYNPGWRNVGLPSSNARGERIANPFLALDLHYLLTAYGAAELHPEVLLGYGMQAFHETPVLAREVIRRSLAQPGAPEHLLSVLATSELADQVEQIKITPETMNTEELSRLWTAFGAKYRPNAAYKVTVVLIESRKSTRPALPVLERKIYAKPFRLPVIETIGSKAAPDAAAIENQKILAGYQLVISGTELNGDFVMVTIDGIDETDAVTAITDTQIIILLPDNLQPGIHEVQVVHQTAMGSPPALHKGVSSNAQAFVLCPEVGVGAVDDVQGTGDALRSATVTVTVTPRFRETQRIVLLLNQLNSEAGKAPMIYSFQAPVLTLHSPPILLDTVAIPVSGVQAGTYLVRIRVDGAESPLGVDAAGNFSTPQVIIP
jgi:hypothetical protein